MGPAGALGRERTPLGRGRRLPGAAGTGAGKGDLGGTLAGCSPPPPTHTLCSDLLSRRARLAFGRGHQVSRVGPAPSAFILHAFLAGGRVGDSAEEFGVFSSRVLSWARRGALATPERGAHIPSEALPVPKVQAEWDLLPSPRLAGPSEFLPGRKPSRLEARGLGEQCPTPQNLRGAVRKPLPAALATVLVVGAPKAEQSCVGVPG